MNAPTSHPLASAAAEQRLRLWLDGDLTAMADLLDTDLVYVHSTGQVHDKTQLLRFLAEDLRVVAVERQPQTCVADGDLACLAFVQVMRAQLLRAPHTEIQARSQFTEVWRRTQGTWRLLRAQSTALAEPRPGDAAPNPSSSVSTHRGT